MSFLGFGAGNEVSCLNHYGRTKDIKGILSHQENIYYMKGYVKSWFAIKIIFSMAALPGRKAMAKMAIKVWLGEMPKNPSFDSSKWVMKVILLNSHWSETFFSGRCLVVLVKFSETKGCKTK